MNLKELAKLILDEKAADSFLTENGILIDYKRCIKCGSERINLIRRGKYICYGCRYEWDFRRGSILDECRIASSTFIGLLKMFELEIPSYVSAKLMKVNSKVSDKVYNTIRRVLSGEMVEENQDKKVFEFSVKEENGKIRISNYSKLIEGDKIIIQNKRHIGYVYEFIIEYEKKNKIAEQPKPPSLTATFLRELNYKLRRIRKIHYKNMYFYVKEVEFRFNNWDNDLFWAIIEEIKVKKC